MIFEQQFKTYEVLNSRGLIGDLNGDGEINSTDYSLLKRYILRKIDTFPVSDDLWSADLNGDGDIDSTDYSLIKRYILRK